MQKIKMMLMKLTEEELLVVEALNPKVAWGPTTEEMDQITQQASTWDKRQKILEKIFEHIRQNDKFHWKQVYKALLLVEHMAIHADEECLRYFKDNVRYIAQLKDSYKFRDEDGVDKGINVRKRAETVADMLQDEQLPEKRREGQAQKAKYSACVTNVEGHFTRNDAGPSSYQQQSYQAPQPTYQAPQPTYQAPQPAYQAPEVQYQQPVQPVQPVYQQPVPGPARPQIAFQPAQPVVQRAMPAPAPVPVAPAQTDLLDDIFGGGSAPAPAPVQQPAFTVQQPAPSFVPGAFAPAPNQFQNMPQQQAVQQPVAKPAGPQVQVGRTAPKPDLSSLLDF